MATNNQLDDAQFARLNRLGGDVLIRELIDLFLRNAPERLEQARLGLAAGELPAVALAAHSMKSKAANLGAAHLQELSARLERAADGEKDAAAAAALLLEFEAEIARVVALLKEKRASVSP